MIENKSINFSEENNKPDELSIGRISAVFRDCYKIIINEKEKLAKLKASIYYNDNKNEFPTVGDFVEVKENKSGEDIIYNTLERKSKLSRLDSFNDMEQILAANFDYVFIISSLNQDFNIKKIERYLTIAWESGGMPVIILTKSDLVSDYSQILSNLREIAFGIDIIPISSYTKEGIDLLEKYLQPQKTTVFLGSSGVGKSSLVNVLMNKELMKVKEIREEDSRGRHTTTHRQLIELPNKSLIIDIPGIREVGLWETKSGLEDTFQDIEEITKKCQFSNCTHTNEPNCKINEALSNGELERNRWINYLKLKKEAKYIQQKQKIMEKRLSNQYKEKYNRKKATGKLKY